MNKARMPELALLRGINVSGRHTVPMAQLKEIFAALGCTAVRTYIQSGNVIYTPPSPLTAATISAALAVHFDFPIPVVLRSAAEMEATVAGNPFSGLDVPLTTLHAVFLDAVLPVGSEQMLASAALPGEQFALGDGVLYLHLPLGVAGSKLALVPGKPKFGATGTMRNWTTTLKLAEMLKSR